MNLNPDIWREIAARSSNDVLVNLSLTSLRDSLSVLVADNDFWYQRAEYLAGKALAQRPQADWKKIYNSILQVQQGQLWPLNDLDLLLVLEEMYGALQSQRSFPRIMQEQNIWSRVEDAAVLNYLLENGTIKYNATVIQSHMYDLLNSHNVELVAALFKLLRDDIEHPAMLVYLHRSIDYLPMFKLFYEADKYSPNDHLTTLIRAIRSREAAEVVEFILTVYQPDDHVRDSLIVRAAIIGNVEAVKLLMSAAPDGGVSSVNIMYEFIDDYRAKILNDSSDRESGRIAVALYLLPQVDLARFGRLYNTTPLLYSLGKNRQELFKLLLTDPRVDPVAMLPRILASMNKHTTDAMIKILVSSPRFAIQQRTKKEVDMLLDAISVYSKQNTLEGYRIGVFRAGESNLDPKIASGKTLHSQIVRYIVLAQPTAAELLDWLIGLHDRTVATAASLVLDRDEKLGLGADSAIMQPIRALLLALLYPTVTLQEHIALLQADGYTKTAIVQSAALIGAFMGKERLQRE